MSLQNYEMIKAPRYSGDKRTAEFSSEEQKTNLRNDPYGALLDSSIEYRAKVLGLEGSDESADC